MGQPVLSAPQQYEPCDDVAVHVDRSCRPSKSVDSKSLPGRKRDTSWAMGQFLCCERDSRGRQIAGGQGKTTMIESESLLITKRIPLNNGKFLRIARLGHGPPIVFLHGYPENLQIWSKLAPLLADRFEIIAFDWPGMGYSDEWPGGTTPKIIAKRLLAIIDELQLQRPTIVGMDMGGQPALAFA